MTAPVTIGPKSTGEYQLVLCSRLNESRTSVIDCYYFFSGIRQLFRSSTSYGGLSSLVLDSVESKSV